MSTVGSKRSNERKLFFILVKHNLLITVGTPPPAIFQEVGA